jgi:hypothetical protein
MESRELRLMTAAWAFNVGTPSKNVAGGNAL